MQNGSFSFIDFYSRRVKRLFPALFVMCATCIVVAYFIFLPEDLVSFGKSLVAAIFYFSNFFFYAQTDYFASDLELSPLLHTWSLSVEEQFYLFFPVFLLFLHNRCRKHLFSILCATAIISLVVSQALLYSDKSLSFFASPTRFYQFLIGGIIAIAPNVNGGRWIKEGLNIVGLAAILVCLFTINSETPFPGINALYPTLATAMIIFAGQTKGLLTSRLLSIAPAQFFGNISYSLYLWHWPVIVFYKMQYTAAPTKLEKVGLFIVSIVLGYLSWKFVEHVFRHRKGATLKMQPIYSALAISCAISAFGIFFATSDGLKFRFSEKQLFLSQYLDYDPVSSREGTCFLSSNYASFSFFKKSECVKFDSSKPNYLLIGDSHAAHFYGAIHKQLAQVNLTQVTSSGCRPTINYVGIDYCTSLMHWAYEDLVANHHFDTIILSGRWHPEDLESLKKTTQMLSDHTKKLIILGPIVTYDQALPRLLARSYPNLDDSPILVNATQYAYISSIDKTFKKTFTSPAIHYVSVLDTICPDKQCIKVTPEGVPMQWDYGHLTDEGSQEIIGKLVANNLL